MQQKSGTRWPRIPPIISLENCKRVLVLLSAAAAAAAAEATSTTKHCHRVDFEFFAGQRGELRLLIGRQQFHRFGLLLIAELCDLFLGAWKSPAASWKMPMIFCCISSANA